MNEVTQNATSASVTASVITGTATATGTLETINHYAPLIGLSLTVFSLCLAVVFFIIGHKRDSRRITLDNKQIKETIREQVVSEMKEKEIQNV